MMRYSLLPAICLLALVAPSGCGPGAPSVSPANATLPVVREASRPHVPAGRVVYALNDAAGARPSGSLTIVDGTLWGVATTGGDASCTCGTVFSVNLATGKAASIQFTGGTGDGSTPVGGLTYRAPYLYGSTAYGGTNGVGTIFRVDPNARTKTILYNFDGTAGRHPQAGLADDRNVLWGTASGGGAGDAGTLFSFDPSTKAIATVVDLSGNGRFPLSTPLVSSGLVFPTKLGGPCDCGTLLFVAGRRVLVDHAFTGGTGGKYPIGGVVETPDAIEYGTAQQGGSCPDSRGCGVLYSFDPAKNAFEVLHRFAGPDDGQFPSEALTVAAAQTGTPVYGTTLRGGTTNANCPQGCGTVFRFEPGKRDSYAVIYRFPGGAGGAEVRSSLLLHDGKLYGTTEQGGTGNGTVFEITP